MEASEKAEPAPEAPETLPADISEATPKKTKMIAVVIVLVLIVAALAAAWGMGLFGGAPSANSLPSAGAKAVTETTIAVGGNVSFQSLATDTDGTIAEYAWYFGDGTNKTGNATVARNVTHTFAYGGDYWVYHVVKDDKGAVADNEASMIRVKVIPYIPDISVGVFDNATKPYGFLASNEDIIKPNITVKFNATGFGVQWLWVNESNHSEGWFWDYGSSYLTNHTFNSGVDSNWVVLTRVGDYMQTQKNYTSKGHYAAKLNVTYMASTGASFSTMVMKTIHVLKPTTSTPGAIKNPDTFISAEYGEPQFLDPAIDYESAGSQVLNNVYETLIWYQGASTGILIPQLATAVPSKANGLISSDGLNYTFNLRSNVKMHDGTTMNATDVVYSMMRALRIHDPSGPSFMLEMVLTDKISYFAGQPIKNWTASSTTFNASWLLAKLPSDPNHIITETDIQAVSEASVIQVNDNTVKFRLTHQFAATMPILAYTVASVVSKEYVVAHGGIVNGEHNTYMFDHEAGTGPYKLVSWEQGAKIHLTRFTDYWGIQPSIKDVLIIRADDTNSRILMLQAGDADSITLEPQFESVFAGKAEYRIVKGLPDLGIRMGVFNFDFDETQAATYGNTVPNDFFQDIHTRKAFEHIFDWTLFISSVLKGMGQKYNSVIVQGLLGYNASIPYYDYNLTEAKAELQLAQYNLTASWWDKGFTIALFYNTGNTARRNVCLFLKTALNSLDPLNPTKFDATVNSLDWDSAYLPATQTKGNQMPFYVIGWGPDYVDPDDYAGPLLWSKGTFAIGSSYYNAAIDALVEAAAIETDASVRANMYSSMSLINYNDPAYVFLYQPLTFHIERSWVHGYYFNPIYGHLYYPALSKS